MTIVTGSASVSDSTTIRAPVREGLKRAVYDEPHGPLPAMLLALTVLAGVVDATSILRLGNVFVATMTGNLVFIGLAAAGAKGFAVGTSALALAGFVIGVLIGGRACDAARSHRGRALRNVLGVKLWLAGVVTLIAVLTGPHFPKAARDAMVVLLATSMGAQLAAIRYLKVPDLLTVVLTMTITGVLTERKRGWHDPAMLRRGLSLVAFAFGALSGALLILNVSVTAALSFGLAIIIGTTIAAHRVSRSSTSWSAPRTA
jgi:uncharacterized membrane protein YoaK (UPF0700 family)